MELNIKQQKAIQEALQHLAKAWNLLEPLGDKNDDVSRVLRVIGQPGCVEGIIGELEEIL